MTGAVENVLRPNHADDCECARCREYWEMTPPDERAVAQSSVQWVPIASAPRHTYGLIALAGSHILAIGTVADDGCGAWINGEYWSTATHWAAQPELPR